MILSGLTRRLRELDDAGDQASWPAEAVAFLRDAGCFAHSIPRRFGGREVSPRERVETYEAVAAGSLTLALILTQHDAACELLADSDYELAPADVLPRCARGDALLTVGISQLTTAQRSGGPTMKAARVDDGFTLNGYMPWVTSSPKADYVVTGAVLPYGQEILACLKTNAPGVTIAAPMRFAALNAGLTGRMECADAWVDHRCLIRGPVVKALERRAPVKSLTVSSVGMGMAHALLDGLVEHRESLMEAAELIDGTMIPAYESLRSRWLDAADALTDREEDVPAIQIRSDVNALVVRLGPTYLTLAKGSGYLASHRAQRLCQEAMFFLVWSAPASVQLGSLRNLWTGPDIPPRTVRREGR